MVRTFDQWWKELPKDITKDTNIKSNTLFNKEPVDWVKLHSVIVKIKKTNMADCIPKKEELDEWMNSVNKDKFYPSKLREINPTVSKVILNKQDDIKKLLKSVRKD